LVIVFWEGQRFNLPAGFLWFLQGCAWVFAGLLVGFAGPFVGVAGL